jgi:hypothetical protein
LGARRTFWAQDVPLKNRRIKLVYLNRFAMNHLARFMGWYKLVQGTRREVQPAVNDRDATSKALALTYFLENSDEKFIK